MLNWSGIFIIWCHKNTFQFYHMILFCINNIGADYVIVVFFKFVINFYNKTNICGKILFLKEL